MHIYVGADHRGFHRKQQLKTWLTNTGLSVTDLGASSYQETDDYVSYAYAVAKAVQQDQKTHHPARGIVLCGSGVGVEMVAGKVSGIRCGLGFSVEQVQAARYDDDILVLALPADFLTEKQAKQLVKTFLETPFSQAERHKRRLEKLKELEYHL